MVETRVGMAPEGSKTQKSVYYSDVEPPSRTAEPRCQAELRVHEVADGAETDGLRRHYRVGFLGAPLVWAERERGPVVVSKRGLRGAGCTLAETNSRNVEGRPAPSLRLPRPKASTALIAGLGYCHWWKRRRSSVSDGASVSPCPGVHWRPLLPKGGGHCDPRV